MSHCGEESRFQLRKVLLLVLLVRLSCFLDDHECSRLKLVLQEYQIDAKTSFVLLQLIRNIDGSIIILTAAAFSTTTAGNPKKFFYHLKESSLEHFLVVLVFNQQNVLRRVHGGERVAIEQLFQRFVRELHLVRLRLEEQDTDGHMLQSGEALLLQLLH